LILGLFGFAALLLFVAFLLFVLVFGLFATLLLFVALLLYVLVFGLFGFLRLTGLVWRTFSQVLAPVGEVWLRLSMREATIDVAAVLSPKSPTCRKTYAMNRPRMPTLRRNQKRRPTPRRNQKRRPTPRRNQKRRPTVTTSPRSQT
jgi:hypothetical protein